MADDAHCNDACTTSVNDIWQACVLTAIAQLVELLQQPR